MSQRKILDFLSSRPDGASSEEIARNLKIRHRHVDKIIQDLEFAGEVFRYKGGWRSTVATLKITCGNPRANVLTDEFNFAGEEGSLLQ